MSMLDEAIYEREDSRENSLERNLFGDGLDSDKEDGKQDGDGEKEKLEAKKAAKKRISTQPRLNPDRLCGIRGICDIDNHFKGIHYKGKNHELEDLTNIMKRLEHWAHRLFPKYTFDDCLFQIERLGKKKQVHNYLNRYRLGELEENKENDNIIDSDGSDNEFARDVDLQAFDEMDQMISEQLSKTGNSLNRTSNTFDDLGIRPLDITNESQSFESARGSQGLHNSHSTQQNSSQQQGRTPLNHPQLTEEQIKTIEQNRLKALERLKQRKLISQGLSSSTTTMNTNGPVVPLPSTSICEEADNIVAMDQD